MSQSPIRALAERASLAARNMIELTSKRKRITLKAIADELDNRQAEILAANEADLEAARKRGRPRGFLERMELSSARFAALTRAVRTIADLKDPIGEQVSRWIRPNGLEIARVRVPIGVVGVAYESRPHVVVHASALCLKLGNAVVFVGDEDCQRTSRELLAAILKGGEEQGLPQDALQAVFSDNPVHYRDLARMEGLVDLMIPRGGRDLVADVVDFARVPVLKHLGGACHVYVDASADLDAALSIMKDCGCHEPYACNSADTVLLHRSIAASFMEKLFEEQVCRKIKLKADEEVTALISSGARALEAEDMAVEPEMRIQIVDDVEAAIELINRQGSHVADAVVAEDEGICEHFLRGVDSACVMANASPRFADGAEFGMGAEVGISTDKLHARGPIGLVELTTTKYIVQGNGQVRG